MLIVFTKTLWLLGGKSVDSLRNGSEWTLDAHQLVKIKYVGNCITHPLRLSAP